MSSRISQMRSGQQPQQQQKPQLNEQYLAQVKSMMHSQNPQQMLMNAVSNNPQMRVVMQMLGSNGGGNPKQIFETMARQRGIDPNWAIQQLMS